MGTTDSMGLQEFVHLTMIEIMNGVSEAAIDAKSPHTQGTLGGVNPFIKPSSIDFDLAVTVSQAGQGKGSLKVSVLGITVGGEGSTSGATESVHRIKFSVPVTFAPQPFDTERVTDSHTPTPTGTQ